MALAGASGWYEVASRVSSRGSRHLPDLGRSRFVWRFSARRSLLRLTGHWPRCPDSFAVARPDRHDRHNRRVAAHCSSLIYQPVPRRPCLGRRGPVPHNLILQERPHYPCILNLRHDSWSLERLARIRSLDAPASATAMGSFPPNRPASRRCARAGHWPWIDSWLLFSDRRVKTTMHVLFLRP